jgi:REP element-mobilizing transposase RayT
MGHTSTNLLVHLIFSTKQRAPCITTEIESDLHAYLGGIIREIGGVALAINGTTDHVHILTRVPAKRSIADLVCGLTKTNSSRWIHERWPEHLEFAWQTGYGAFTVSESGVDGVRDYISRQKEHHKNRSFQEEFLTFLRKNKITFDERYLWD